MDNEADVKELKLKKSELKADCTDAYDYLVRNERGLVRCDYEEAGEDILFVFQTSDMHPLRLLRGESLEYRLRFLVNFRELEELYDNYELFLDEDNIFYDSNFMPYFAKRDIWLPGESIEPFMEIYRCIAVGVLNKRYDFTTVKDSGTEITRRDKSVAFINDYDDADVLSAEFLRRANDLHRINAEELIHINRRRHKVFCTIIAIIIALFIGLLGITGYAAFVKLPEYRAVISASRAYVVEDYVQCVDSLRNVPIEDMDTYTKYILAVSYARSEALEREELSNVLNTLSIYSNEAELEYWIALGRGHYGYAENRAMALSDDKLLIYAYMKELSYLESNVAMDGEEKQSRMNELSNAITEIGKKYTEEE